MQGHRSHVFDRYRLLCDQARDIILFLDRDDRIVEANLSAEQAYGYSLSELLSMNARNLVAVDQTLLSQDEKDQTETRGILFESRHQRKDGTVFPVEISARRAMIGGRRLCLCIVRDISQRQQTEAALAGALERLRTVLANAPVAIVGVDRDGRLVFAEGQMLDRLGLSSPTLIGRSVFEVAAERPALAGTAWQVLVGGRYTGAFELEVGGRILEMHHQPLPSLEGDVTGVVAVATDITERRQAEEEREALLTREQAVARIGRALVSEQELDRVAEVVVDECAKRIRVDGAVLWLANLAERELAVLARRPADLRLCPGERVPMDAPLASAMAALRGEPVIVSDGLAVGPELTMTREWCTEGGVRSVLAVPLLNRGRLEGVVSCVRCAPNAFSSHEVEISGTIADLCAMAIGNARLYQDLHDREEQVSLLLKATIDAQEDERQRIRLEMHDGVTQSITSTQRHLHRLESLPDLTPAISEEIERVKQLVAEASREVRAVIGGLRPTGLDTVGLVAALRQELGERAGESGLQIAFEGTDLCLSAPIEVALYRIAHEATINAVKHARATRIEVKIEQDDRGTRLVIRDDGRGFDPTCPPASGPGARFGIAGMRKRAELLGARLSIGSRPGEGTEVIVEVPRDGAGRLRSAAEQPSRQERRNGGPISVLLADDHALARQGLLAILAGDRSIHVVGEAQDGWEALRLAARLHPQVVLMDIRMPGMDGVEATKRLKAQEPGIAVVILSAFEDEALVVAALQAGAAGYLLKDATPELISHTIGAAVAGGSPIKSELLRRVVGHLTASAQVAETANAPWISERVSARERDVLKLIGEGWTNREIGNTLGFAEVTVKKQVRRILNKLGAADRTQAVLMAHRAGLIN